MELPQPDELPSSALSPAQVRNFRKRLAAWYQEHARVLPWREATDPYRVWVSEIMLQQTRVAAVIDHYQRFLQLFPSLVALALAPESEVLAAWSGLGYYRRARMLHNAAQFVLRQLSGTLPTNSTDLRKLPGIGEYTSAAIASISFGESIAVVDGNVERVLLRTTGRPEVASAVARAFVSRQAKALVPSAARAADPGNPPGDHNQAMMELGATICLPRAPLCLQCPVYSLCRTRGEHATPPRARQRSSPAAYLLATRKRSVVTEVLLQCRPADASLMPGMYELPPLPLDAVESREPILRLRHAITNTNYYVGIYAQSGTSTALRRAIPAAKEDLRWQPIHLISELPITGLARKVLNRMHLYSVNGPETPDHRRDAPLPKAKKTSPAPAKIASKHRHRPPSESARESTAEAPEG